MSGDTFLRPLSHPPNSPTRLNISQFPPLTSSSSPPSRFQFGSSITVTSPWAHVKAPVPSTNTTTPLQEQIATHSLAVDLVSMSIPTPSPHQINPSPADITMQEAV